MSYMLINTENKTTLIKDRLPLSPEATLDWIGFSENKVYLDIVAYLLISLSSVMTRKESLEACFHI
jgi:hypothetical protein